MRLKKRHTDSGGLVTLSGAEAQRCVGFCFWGGRRGRERPAGRGAGGRCRLRQQGGGLIPPLGDSTVPNEVLCC